jgi:uncharacterized protein YceH (UPF0502 family)
LWDLTAPELRVLGCLIEKQRTTPDQYPLTLNSLRLACNQSTNRDPVVDYDEGTVREAAQRLGAARLARFTSGAGSRAAKYRQVADEALGVDDGQLAVLAVLMLRGPQTPGELKLRTERLHPFESLAAVVETLDALIEKDHVVCLGRRPGQKEDRYAHLLGRDEPEAQPRSAEAEEDDAPRETRMERLEREVAELRERLVRLERELGASVEDQLQQDEVEPAAGLAPDLGHAGDLGESESLVQPDGPEVAGVDAGDHHV